MEVFGHLFPEHRLLSGCGERIKSKKPFGRKTGGLTGQPVECREKQSCDEEHEKTESDLYSDQRVHQATARVWVLAAFERARRRNCGGAQRRRQAKQKRYTEGERHA